MANGKNQDFYKQLRSIDAKKLARAKPEDIVKELKSNDIKDASPAAVTGFLIAAKVAHQIDYVEFEDFMNTGEMPALKLSDEEMKVLRGGINWLAVAGVAVGGAALYLGAKYVMGREERGLEKDYRNASSFSERVAVTDRATEKGYGSQTGKTFTSPDGKTMASMDFKKTKYKK